jgi:TonB family protein
MSEMWKKWEGQVIDHQHRLQRFLGSTDHSVVFLAEANDNEQRQVAIKFVSADFPGKDQQLAAWQSAAQLNHPNLIRIYGSGVCTIEDMNLLYVVMEYAEENLAQVLPRRPLTPEEAKETLNTAINVLVYLHGQNLVHGHVKPSNILAADDRLKLSSDTIAPADEIREMRRERSTYDAPELPTAPYTPSADTWSLGVTLVEAFTQQPAVLPFNERVDPVIPTSMPDPFLEIAGHTLRRDPELRWSSEKIAERLNPSATAVKTVAAAAGAQTSSPVASSAAPVRAATPVPTSVAPPTPSVTLSPLDVPLSKEPAIPLSKMPPAPLRDEEPVVSESVRPEARRVQQTVALPSYVIPLFGGALVVLALILLPFVFRHHQAPTANTAATNHARSSTNPPSTATKPVRTPVQPAATPNSASQVPPAKTTPPPPASSAPASTASASPDDSVSAVTPKRSTNVTGDGEALDQVMPEASSKALATIRGTVRVGVKVHVDPTGNVANATLDNSGPSRYFADLALKAAKQWVFTPPEADGHSVASDWLIQFGFTNAGAKATANQIAP